MRKPFLKTRIGRWPGLGGGVPGAWRAGAGLWRDERGQAVMEYVLMLTVVMGIATMIGIGFRKTLFKLWTIFAQEISAGCPGCPADPRIRLR